jgi:hypothetical protein
MNVRRFFAFVAEEEESIAVDAEYGWHALKLRPGAGIGQVIVLLTFSRRAEPRPGDSHGTGKGRRHEGRSIECVRWINLRCCPTPKFCCKATRAPLALRNYDGRFVSSNVRYAGAERELTAAFPATDRDGRWRPARVGRRTAWRRPTEAIAIGNGLARVLAPPTAFQAKSGPVGSRNATTTAPLRCARCENWQPSQRYVPRITPQLSCERIK